MSMERLKSAKYADDSDAGWIAFGHGCKNDLLRSMLRDVSNISEETYVSSTNDIADAYENYAIDKIRGIVGRSLGKKNSIICANCQLDF